MASNAFMGIATGFFGGLASQAEETQKNKDAIDQIYQRELAKVNPEIAIRTATERVQGEEMRKTQAAKTADPVGEQLRQVIGAGKVDVPGQQNPAMPTNTPADMSDNGAPIQPQTAAIPDANAAPAQQTADASQPPTETPPAPAPQESNVMPNPVEPAPEAAAPVIQTPHYTPLEVLPPTLRPLFMAIKDPDLREAAIASRAQPGTDPEKWQSSTYHNFLALDQQREKNNPIDEASLGDQDVEHIKAAKNLGIIKDTSSIKPLTPREQAIQDAFFIKVNDARIGAVQGINTVNSVLGITTDTGPYSSNIAKAKAVVDSMTDQQISDTVKNIYVLDKDNIQLTNATMKQLGNVRPGIGIANLEKAGNPSSDMPPEARKEVALQVYANYLQNINHLDALASGPEGLSVLQRTKFAQEHDDSNPTILGDGKTLNPNVLSFKEWRTEVANGTFKKGVSGQDIRKSQGTAEPKTKEPKTDWIYDPEKGLIPNQ